MCLTSIPHAWPSAWSLLAISSVRLDEVSWATRVQVWPQSHHQIEAWALRGHSATCMLTGPKAPQCSFGTTVCSQSLCSLATGTSFHLGFRPVFASIHPTADNPHGMMLLLPCFIRGDQESWVSTTASILYLFWSQQIRELQDSIFICHLPGYSRSEADYFKHNTITISTQSWGPPSLSKPRK